MLVVLGAGGLAVAVKALRSSIRHDREQPPERRLALLPPQQQHDDAATIMPSARTTHWLSQQQQLGASSAETGESTGADCNALALRPGGGGGGGVTGGGGRLPANGCLVVLQDSYGQALIAQQWGKQWELAPDCASAGCHALGDGACVCVCCRRRRWPGANARTRVRARKPLYCIPPRLLSPD
jgi:hypothetical protein